MQPTDKKNAAPDDVIVLEADQSMMRKLGGISLDKIISTDAIKSAETIISSAASSLYDDCVKEGNNLQGIAVQLEQSGKLDATTTKKIIDISFSIKAKSGQSGHDLISALAKSLHLFCEDALASHSGESGIKIILWHMKSIRQLLAANTRGTGGPIGTAIIAEMEKLKAAG